MATKRRARRKNAYQVLEGLGLGIDRNMSVKDIRKAYTIWKRQVKRSMQKGGGDDHEKRKREEEQDAFEVLSNEGKRAKYDESLEMTRRKLLEKLSKHCFNTDGDPASVNASDFDELDTEQLRHIYLIYDDDQSFKVLETLPDDAPEKPKGMCMEENTLIHMLNAHAKKDAQGRSPPWANPTSRKPLSEKLGKEISHRITVRCVELMSAVEVNDLQRVTYLLENGANPNIIVSREKHVPFLCWAILSSPDLPVIEAILKRIDNHNICDHDGLASLLYVQKYKHDKDKLVKLLKEHGANPSEQLLWAVKANNLQGVDDLIAYGADINAVIEGNSILMYAIQFSCPVPALQELIQRGAAVNQLCKHGVTPVFGIIKYEGNKHDLVKLFVDHGANINHVDTRGFDALYWVIVSINDTNTVKTLLDHGATVTKVYRNGNTRNSILTTALQYQRPRQTIDLLVQKDPSLINIIGSMGPPIIQAINQKSNRMFEWCLEHGANVGLLDNNRRTILISAVVNGTYYMVSTLIENGENVHHTDNAGNTALHYAMNQNNKEILKLLLDAGADVNVKNQSGNTPLHVATSKHKVEFISVLVSRGADVNANNVKRESPMKMSVSSEFAHNHDDVFNIFEILWTEYKRLIPREHYDAKLLLTACKSNNADVIFELIRSGVNTKVIDNETGATCLIYAISYAHEDRVLKPLIDSGVDIHKVDHEGRNALMYAVLADHMPAVLLLLEHKANVKYRDADGSSALHLAVGAGDEEIIDVLIKAGCDVNAVDHKGNTALILAADVLNAPVMKVLLEAGADPNARNNHKQTSLHYVSERADEEPAKECMEMLMSYGAKLTHNMRMAFEEHGVVVPHQQSAGKPTKPKTTNTKASNTPKTTTKPKTSKTSDKK